MNARDELEADLGKGLHDMSSGWERINSQLEAFSAEVLRAAAAQQWAFAREHWIPTDDDSPSAARRKDHKFGAAERLIGLIDPAAPALMPRHINIIPKGAGFLVRWQLGEETNSVWRASRAGADALAAELRDKGAGQDTAPRCENPKCGRPITRGAQWCSTWCHQASDTQAGKVIPKDETTQPADFFQPGRTYLIDDGADRGDFLGWTFRAEHISTHQETVARTAFGYLSNAVPGSEWHPHYESEESWTSGWRDITGSDA